MLSAKWSARAVVVIAAAFIGLASGRARAATFTIDTGTVTNPHAPLLLGVDFDARASLSSGGASVGYYSSTNGQALPIGEYWEESLPQTSIRYPAGPVNTWDWKGTIGPIANRPPEPLFLNQKIAFGLDEFMEMVIRTGAGAANTTFLVNIYKDVNNKNVPQAIQDAADLVEYLNGVVGENKNGGIDYAALRAQYTGHVEPFGVKEFSLGNEPWAFVEYDYRTSTNDPSNPAVNGAKRYADDMQAFITAMHAIDPTVGIVLPIVLPTVTNNTQKAQALAWNNILMNELGTQAHALTINMYYESQPINGNTRSITNILGALDTAIAGVNSWNAAHNEDLTMVIGEQAHTYQITPPNQVLNPNFAQQWQGALSTAGFLMSLSSREEIERAHNFIYGNGHSEWHPIRRDGVVAGQGVFTILPAASLYDELEEMFLERAISVGATGVGLSADGVDLALRTGAFLSGDGLWLNVIIVNHDTLTQLVNLSGLQGYDLVGVRKLWASSPTSETMLAADLALFDIHSAFSIDPLSVLMLQLRSTAIPEPTSATVAAALAVGLVRFRRRRAVGDDGG